MNNREENTNPYSRRSFITKSSLGLGAISAGLVSSSWGSSIFQEKKIGIAIVGLGYYGTILSEALTETKTAYLAGIVTGSPEKAKTWQAKYGLKKENIYNYDNFDSIRNNKDIDVVYVVLPNGLHKEYTIRAAEAGKHVICEKPMARNAKECEEMIAACDAAKVSLSIGYRMHFEPTTQEIMRIQKENVFGKVKYVTANAGFHMGRCTNWKCGSELSGGVTMDMGVYSLQAARYVTGEEPISVSAQTFKQRPEMFTEVDETTTFQLEFPGGAIANLQTTFYSNINSLQAIYENGWIKVDPFSAYRGIKGSSSKGALDFPVINQQAAQMDHVANSILNNQPMLVPGDEGLKDMIVVDAIYKSIATGQKIKLGQS